MRKEVICVLFVMAITSIPFSLAHPHQGQILIDEHNHEPIYDYISINGMIGIEKTTLFFHSSEDNKLPWGFVEGKITNPVVGYPVIIQFFQDGEAKHFAQTNVLEDDTYEYRFRVFSMDDGHKIKIFDGDYQIIIFKVVYLNGQV